MRDAENSSASDGPQPQDGSDPHSPSPEEIADVERDRDELKAFIGGLKFGEIRNGGWFAKLLTFSLGRYSETVNWKYFQEKYRGVPPDAIVDQRIKMAARYAAIEGGLSAAAYTGAVAATIGSLGGASPITIPTAVGTIMIDVTYLSQLQIRLAYDIAVLYRIPIVISDPDDLWKLIRIAFTIKGGELAREGFVKAVPALVRPLIKSFFSGRVLAAAKGLPVVGKFLLQRNFIKVGIPLVGVPLAVVLNRWSTLLAGKHAQSVFRNEARVMEVASRLVEQSRHPRLLLWVAWLVVDQSQRKTDDEALLLKHLMRVAEERHGIVDEDLSRVVVLDPDDVWRLVDLEDGSLYDIVIAAEAVAAIDGRINTKERLILEEIRRRCDRAESSPK